MLLIITAIRSVFFRIGWYTDAIGRPPTAYLSSFDGLKKYTGGLPRFAIDVNNNIRIGTRTPSSKFHLVLNNEFAYIERPSASNNAGHYYTGPDDALSYNFFTGPRENSNNYHIYNAQRNENELTIQQYNSYVGIGTSIPDAALAVNGTINSKEVKVDASIPVAYYVFERNYPLKPLTEVEKYIIYNKHLSEISPAQVLETGV